MASLHRGRLHEQLLRLMRKLLAGGFSSVLDHHHQPPRPEDASQEVVSSGSKAGVLGLVWVLHSDADDAEQRR
jgi:hypothetical protein